MLLSPSEKASMQYDENVRVASRTRERRERVAPHTAEKKTQPRHQGVETSET